MNSGKANASQDLSEYIRKTLMKTGFPLELEISSILESQLAEEQGWDITYNRYFFDDDEKKGREIDISVLFNPLARSKDVSKVKILPEILIECKKSANKAWVFFTRRTNPSVSSYWGQYFDNFQLETDFSQSLMGSFMDWALGNLDYFESKKISSSYAQVRLKNERDLDKSEIFEGIMQLIKATMYECKQRIGKFKRLRGNLVFFFMPVIIFDGELFEARLKSGTIIIEPAKYVLLKTYYKPDFRDGPLMFFIEIVQKNHVKDWLENTKTRARKLVEAAKVPEIDKAQSALRGLVYTSKT